MPPKQKPATEVYAVVSTDGLDSIHASLAAAEERVETAKSEGDYSDVNVKPMTLQGGTVSITKEKAAPKSRAKPAKKVETEEDDEEEAGEEEEPKLKAKANTAAKKTASVAEQRATNAKKGTKNAGADLPENVKALLAGNGDILAGESIVVTGVPPRYGRKNVETLIKNYGGKLLSALSKNVSLVVVGDKAGPKKLEQIEEFGTETMNEDQLIARLENGGGGSSKRSADEDGDEEDDEDDEEKPLKKRAKKA